MKTIAQLLSIQDFPFEINDKNNNRIYQENSKNYWVKRKFDSNHNEIFSIDSENYWVKREFDENNNRIFYENSDGIIEDSRPKVKELTVSEISKLLGYEIKIVK